MAKKTEGGIVWDFRGLFHQVMTSLLTAVVLGGLWFYQNTNIQLALLQQDVVVLHQKIDGAVALMEARRVLPPPIPFTSPQPR